MDLNFAEHSLDLAVSPNRSLEAVMARFQSAHLDPDSPIRAVRHEPAVEATFTAIPAAVDGRLRAALEKRGIARLYSH
jgi:DEAD/DEAH box helicase domain-containing protein